jgi:hypothetical protein
MKRWLTSLFLLFALAVGALAGATPFSGNAENGMSAMECCKKKTKDCNGSDSMSAAQLCCAVNCNSPAPSSPGAPINFSPVAVIISDSILKQIALLFGKEKPIQTISFAFERETLPQKFQPKYIQHHSFLI